jgi:hypothetical protein
LYLLPLKIKKRFIKLIVKLVRQALVLIIDLEDREYTGPNIKYAVEELPKEFNNSTQLNGTAVFLGPDGTLYDIDYLPVDKNCKAKF